MFKNLAAYVVLAAFSFLGGMAAQVLRPAEAQAQEPVASKVLRCDELIVTKSIRVGDRDDRHITLCANKEVAGAWIYGANKRAIAIYDVGKGAEQQTAVGIYHDRDRPAGGMEIAIGVNNKGAGFVQIKDKKSVRFIDAKD